MPTGDAAPKLKDPSQWKYIGRDMPVVDNYDMSTGGANFGADATIPGMKIAVVARAPVYRGKVKSFDATAALAVQGVEQVVEIPALADDTPAEFHAMGGVAVVGTNTWSVLEGRRLLAIEWDDGPNVAHDSGTYDDRLREAARTGGHVIRDRGNVDEAFAAAAKVMEAEYFVPYFIHTPMEPPAALVDANVRPVKIITSTQSPNETRQYVAKALGLEKTDVECQVTLLGGGFGRKSKPDFACEAAILSKMVGAPVRVQWTREDEIRNGYYHAASAHRMKAGMDANGKVTAWHHTGAWPSLIALWAPQAKTGHAIEYGLGLIDTPYNEVPNLRIENGEADAMIRVGWYRSVNNIQHAFAMNCFANELAEAAGRDPVEYLLELIGDADVMDLKDDGVLEHWNYGDSTDDWPIMPKRLSNALRTVAAKSGYGKTLPKGHGLGLAAHRSFHSYVATAVHVVVHDDGSFTHPAGGRGRRLRSLREPGRGAQADRGRFHLRPHRRAVRQDHHQQGRGGAEQLPRLSRHAHERCAARHPGAHRGGLRAPASVRRGRARSAAVRAGAGERDLQRDGQADSQPADRRPAQVRVVRSKRGGGLHGPRHVQLPEYLARDASASDWPPCPAPRRRRVRFLDV